MLQAVVRAWCTECVGNEAHACDGFVLQVKLAGGEVIGAPTPADVMASASRTVLSKLDRVEGEVIDFFMPAASRLIAGPHPERVLAAALAAMSGFRYEGRLGTRGCSGVDEDW